MKRCSMVARLLSGATLLTKSTKLNFGLDRLELFVRCNHLQNLA